MNFKQLACVRAVQGFYVFPVGQNKKPLIEEWPSAATADPDTIAAWANEFPAANVGIFTGKIYGGGALLVVDIDNKKGKNGDETILDLALEGFELPATYEVKTPSGGRHLYYSLPSGSPSIRSRTEVLGRGVDIRSSGGYVVGAGSVIGDRSYEANEAEIQEAPQWLVDRCNTGKIKEEKESKNEIQINEETAVKRATHYLENEAPQAIEGSGGDATTYKVATRVKDCGVSQNKAADLLAHHWNERNSPPWSYEDLLRKVENAYRYGENKVGNRAPEADFDVIEEMPGSTDESYLQTINRDHALIFIEGSHFILHETLDEKGAQRRVYFTEAAFKRKFSPYLVEQGGRQKPKTQAELWLDWKDRRKYSGICFSPGKEPKHGYYNLWSGFTVEPKAYNDASIEARQGFNIFMEHTLENVCAGDKVLHNWLLGYFAHLVQKPYERPLTTLVFRGKKGVGKNAPIDRIGNLLGRTHYLVAHDGRYLTSNFNGHLDSCLVLVLDEAFWSGDKSAEGKLKGISTAPTILIERKNKEPYTVDNLVRLVVIGNEDWLVPASADERRYAVFDVGTGKMQQNEYFHTMRIFMDERGGNQVLLHFLQNFDLSTMDPNVAPITKGLHDQKVASLDLFHEWWLQCLRRGEIQGMDFGDGWQDTIDKDSFRNAFISYKDGRNSRGWAHSEQVIGRLLHQCLPQLPCGSKRREAERTIQVYKFPPLEECRESWDKFIGHKTDWETQ